MNRLQLSRSIGVKEKFKSIWGLMLGILSAVGPAPVGPGHLAGDSSFGDSSFGPIGPGAGWRFKIYMEDKSSGSPPVLESTAI